MSELPVYDAMLKRRSIRGFTDEPVGRDKVDALLRAAMAAPSACNLQPWAFIVVDAPDMLDRLKAAAPQGQYNAPLAIVVCGVFAHIPWDGEGWLLDCGMAAQNMMLEAVELGIASVAIGGFEEDEVTALLDIPDGVRPALILEFGYAAYDRPPLTRYTDEAVYYGKFDPSRPREYRTLEMLNDDIAAGLI